MAELAQALERPVAERADLSWCDVRALIDEELDRS
jgi:hypothetical protein